METKGYTGNDYSVGRIYTRGWRAKKPAGLFLRLVGTDALALEEIAERQGETLEVTMRRAIHGFIESDREVL